MRSLSAQMHQVFPMNGTSDRDSYIIAAIQDLDRVTERTPDDFFGRCEEIKQMMKDAKTQAEEERQLAEAMKRSTVEFADEDELKEIARSYDQGEESFSEQHDRVRAFVRGAPTRSPTEETDKHCAVDA
jgi:hypothetical protein